MVRFSCVLACCLLGLLLLASPATSYPSLNNYYRDEMQYEPEEIIEMLTRLNNLIQMERKMENYKDDITSYKDDITSEKRALDLGLNRGYSGAIHAKHLMAMQAANFAGGPGRRRRAL